MNKTPLYKCESIVKRRKRKTNDAARMRMTLWKKNSSNYTAPFANAMIADLEKNYNAKATTIVPNLQMRS